MGFLASLGGPLAGKLGGAINPLSGLGMAGGPMSGLGAMMGGGGGLGGILAGLGLGGGQEKSQTGTMPPPPASMMPGEMGNVSSPMDPISQGPGQGPTNFGQSAPAGPGMGRSALMGLGQGLQRQGQSYGDAPEAPQQMQNDPLALLRSLGIDLSSNFLGRLGQR